MSKDSIKLTQETLSKYCGEYTPEIISPGSSNFSFVLSCDHLVRIHPNPSVPEVNLIPISDNKFIYGDETGKTVEFIIDKSGRVTSVIFEWWTGKSKFKKI